jgi:hypothetical protein
MNWKAGNSVWLVTLCVLGSVTLAACGSRAPSLTKVGPCAEVQTRAILHLSAAGPRRLWATDMATGAEYVVASRANQVWAIRSGTPDRLMNAGGQVVAYEGDILNGGCLEGSTLFVGPENLPSPDRPPN